MRILMLFILLMILPISNMQAESDHHTKDNNFYVGRFYLTPVFVAQNTALSLSGEGGPKSYRVDGTIGFIACERHRFKVGGEFLGEKLKFEFNNKTIHRWVQQYAVGGKYEFLFIEGCSWLRGFDISGYYLNAHRETLKSNKGKNVTHFKRIAGSS